MPSPFPGMDPYLEEPARWGGVHLGMIYAVHAELNAVLPDGLVAEMDLYVWIEDEDDGERAGVRPDLFVPESGGSGAPGAGAGGGVTAPVVTLLPARSVRRQRRVRIVTAQGDRVVAAVEVLSPANKRPGADRDAYLAKRSQYGAAGTHLLEIDLLRDGHRMPMGRPRPPVADYYAVAVPAGGVTASVWPFSVREAAPVVGVPLTESRPPAPLDLRRCLDRLYDDGSYRRKLAYDRSPVPPLRRPDAEWAAALLAGRAGGGA